MQEILDAAESPGARPNPLDQMPGVGVDPSLRLGPAARVTQQAGRDRLVRRRVGGAEEGRLVCIRGRANVRICDHVGSHLGGARARANPR